MGFLETSLVSLILSAALVASKSAPGGSPSNYYTVTPLPGDLVQNGGFEAGSFSHWDVSGSDQGVATSSHVYSGTKAAYLGTAGSTGGSIYQNLTLNSGTTYLLSFQYSSDGSVPNSFEVSINGNTLNSTTNETTQDYFRQVFAFTASGSSGTQTGTLKFVAQNDGGFDFLDDISVVQIPVPCNNDLYTFNSTSGDLLMQQGKRYPGQPHADTNFPAVDSNNHVLFNYKNEPISPTFPRSIGLGLAPANGAENFISTTSSCRWFKAQANNCPSNTDVGVTPDDDLEALHDGGCVSRSVNTTAGTATYSGVVYTIYQDPYNLGSHWAELDGINFSTTVPYGDQPTTQAQPHAQSSPQTESSGPTTNSEPADDPPVPQASDDVMLSYMPVQIIDVGGGSPPTIQFTAVATSNYPYVAYGAGTKYTPPGGSSASSSDSSGNGACILYKAPGQATKDTAYCDSNPTVCTIECTRTISITAPSCNLQGYTWEFDYHEYKDFKLSPASASTPVDNPSKASFSESISFDNSPTWNVCPTAGSTDYSRIVASQVVHGSFDASTGFSTNAPSSPSGIGQHVDFGFKIYLADPTSSGDPGTAAANNLYEATLTQLIIIRPDGTKFYLIGNSGGQTIGGDGPDQNRVSDFTISPAPVGGSYKMSASSDNKFSTIQISFIPNVGASSGPNILYNSDSDTYPGGVDLTASFAGTISVFAPGSSSAKRSNIPFRRQVSISGNGSAVNTPGVVEGASSQSTMTVTVKVTSPSLSRAINAGTIAGSVLGGIVGLGLLVLAGLFYKRTKRESSHQPFKAERSIYLP